MTCSSTLKPGWSPMTIGLMVLGFIVFWPLGLAMLAYILWGDRFHGMAQDARRQWDQSPMKRGFQNDGFGRTGNVAFDEYREETINRLDQEQREFRDFLDKLRAAKDRAEFDQFMADRRNRPAPETPPAPNAA